MSRASSPPRVASRVFAIGTALVLALPCLATYPHAQAQQTFRTSVELIVVDVRVADRQGRPMPTLRPDQFEVTLDGRRRRVVSAEFTQHHMATLPGQTPRPSDTVVARLGTPTSVPASVAAPSPGPPRHFVIALDATSFHAGDARPAVDAALRFLNQLSAQDLVGVYTLPYGANLTPSTDRVPVRQAIQAIAGHKRNLTGQFDMSVTEIVDITSAAAMQPMANLRDPRRLPAEAPTGDFATEVGSDDSATADALTRLCPLTRGDLSSQLRCREMALAEANEAAFALEEDVVQRVDSFNSMLRVLQESPGRKTVLLLSGGMPVADRISGRPQLGSELRRIGDQATYSNVTIHTLYFDQNMYEAFSVGTQRAKISSGRARNIYTRALSEVTEPTGGMFLEVPAGSFESTIDRLLTTTSSYYVLGVEPDQSDRDGRPHQIKVKVSQNGANVRSRALVVVPRAN